MKKRKRSLWEIICISGIPWFLGSIIAGVYLEKLIYAERFRRTFYINSIEDLKGILVFASVVWLYVVVKNSMWIRTTKKIGLFTWIGKYKHELEDDSVRKIKAQYPAIDEELLSKEPNGLVLGKKGKYYVRVKLQKRNILNAIIMGSTGCGKSVLLLTLLLYQLHRFPKKNDKDETKPMVFYCLDIKPELAKKSVVIKGNKRVHVMNPQDRTSYGWDPYYRITVESSDDDIFEEMDLISRALIDAGKSEKNEFFYQSGRNITAGVLFYTFKQGMSFMQGIEYLLDGDLSTVVKKTLDRIEEKPQFRKVRSLLYPYANKDGEAFQGIELAVRESMAVFARQNVKFFFEGNPKKASPKDLEKKITIFFSLHENLIEQYKVILRMTTMQVMSHCKERPENAHMVTLIIDEAARLGAINWTDFLATSRSHQISTILAFQGISQMQKVWGKEDAKTLIELCRVIEVLSCSDPDMAKVLSEWAGEYKEERYSTNIGGKYDGSSSVSHSEKKILSQADIMNLQEKHEAIAFVKGKYMRMDVENARYYKIPYLRKMSEECLAMNQKSKNKREVSSYEFKSKQN